MVIIRMPSIVTSGPALLQGIEFEMTVKEVEQALFIYMMQKSSRIIFNLNFTFNFEYI
jgi:hypothetical protein